MSTNFGPDSALRRDGVEPLFGALGHSRDRVLEACLAKTIDEAKAAAGRVLEKIDPNSTSHVAAHIDDGDVCFALHFDADLDGRKIVLFGAEWPAEKGVRDQPYVFTIAIRPDKENPEGELHVEMHVESAEATYDVCPYRAAIRQADELHEILAKRPSRSWQPLSSQGLSLVVGGATEVLARTDCLIQSINGG